MLQADLKVLGGKFQGKLIPLVTKRFLVGREQDCHLRPNSESVSRHHCAFLVDDFAIRLRDLGSTNGTRVNGELIHSEVLLNDGDEIQIGKLQLQLALRKQVAVDAPAVAAPPVTIDNSEAAFESTANQSGADTMIEMPVMPPLPGQPVPEMAGDTAILGGANTPAYEMPQYSPPPGYPGVPQPGMPQYAMPPGYPAYPPGYPPMPMGYPPGYPPGYPMAPAGYQPMAYPAAPQAPVAPPPEPAPASSSSNSASAVAAIPVRLPPPESTGVKEPAPVPVAPVQTGEGAKKTEEKPSQSAADIIKQYMQRRTR
ncbi:FHA domain-containing protein [bacterium]|nr:FHA domain-containing protein [bacterium]